MSNDSERITELAARIEEMDSNMREFSEKVARWKAANHMILIALNGAIKEISPEVSAAIPQRLELIRTRTKGDAVMFEAIEDARKFFGD